MVTQTVKEYFSSPGPREFLSRCRGTFSSRKMYGKTQCAATFSARLWSARVVSWGSNTSAAPYELMGKARPKARREPRFIELQMLKSAKRCVWCDVAQRGPKEANGTSKRIEMVSVSDKVRLQLALQCNKIVGSKARICRVCRAVNVVSYKSRVTSHQLD